MVPAAVYGSCTMAWPQTEAMIAFGPLSRSVPDDTGYQKSPPGFSQHTWTDSKPEPSKIDMVASESLPSEVALQQLFDQLDDTKDGIINLPKVRQAITKLQGFSFDLKPEDDTRLYMYLLNDGPNAENADLNSLVRGITREQFVTGIYELLSTLHRLMQLGFTFSQMKIILVAAFERFDANQDGSICFEEMSAAIKYLGLNLEQQDALNLYRFFAPSKEMEFTVKELANEPSLEEQWRSAICRAMELLRKRKGIDGIAGLFGRMQKEFNKSGTLEQRVHRALDTAWDGIDTVCDIAELGVDLAGYAVACNYVQAELKQALQDHTTHDLDFGTLAPFITLIGVALVSITKELNEIVPKEMSEDEAQLYAQIFHPRGFSQAEFRRLLGSPGFRWSSAEPGEVLHSADDETLKLLIRGSAEVCRIDQSDDKPGIVLPAGSTIGESFFFGTNSLWSKENVKARDRVFYTSWDPDRLCECLVADKELSLRLDNLLTETMVANLRVKIQLWHKNFDGTTTRSPHRPSLPKTSKSTAESFELQLFNSLDSNRDGVVSQSEFTSQVSLLEAFWMYSKADGPSKDAGDMVMDVFRKESVDREFLSLLLPSACKEEDSTGCDQVMNVLRQDYIDKHGFTFLLPSICKRLQLGDDDQARKRLFAYFDMDGDGKLSLDEFHSRLVSIEECTSQLTGLTLKDLETVIYRAFEKFDENQDGTISLEEFEIVSRKLMLPLTSRQIQRLHSYFDTDKDGFIDFAEWKANNTGRLNWLGEAMEEQANRKGITEVRVLLQQVHEVLAGPGELTNKVRLAMGKMWDYTDALAELFTAAGDTAGAGFALYGIWKEISGLCSWEDVGDVDLTPFLVFFGILMVSAIRYKAEGEVSNLTEAEAVLYATGFERRGFTVTDFKKLLKFGNARWERYDRGDVVPSTSDTSLRIVSSGACQVCHEEAEACVILGRGRFLGAPHFLDMGIREACRAVEPSMVLVLESQVLKAQLAHDESLTMRFNRIVTRSLVDAFLDSEGS